MRGLLQAVGFAREASQICFPLKTCDAEIEDLELASLGDHQVMGLDISVNDIVFVGASQAVGNLARVIHDKGKRATLPRNETVKGLPVQPLHGDEVERLLVRDIVHRDDVGMIKGGSQLCFFKEISVSFPRVQVQGTKNLERDKPVQAAVAHLVDRAHASFTQLLQNLEVIDLISGQERCVPDTAAGPIRKWFPAFRRHTPRGHGIRGQEAAAGST